MFKGIMARFGGKPVFRRRFSSNMPGRGKALARVLSCVLLTAVAAILTRSPEVTDVFQAAAANARKLPIYSVETSEKKVALSFDAAWGADDTDELLRILKEHDVKATFFLCGYWVDKYPDEVKKIYADGHDIGNHGATHAHGAQLSLEKNKAEITGAHEMVKNILGIEMSLFRPPYGEYNNTVIEAAEALGYYTIQWDVDSLDWKNMGREQEIKHVLNHKNLKNGSIVLFHNDAKYTPGALEPIILGLKEQGYSLVPISELIYKYDYYMDHTGRQIKK